ncbi:thioredoxin, partial [Candidatus Dojkabacteria bacterium]
MSVSAQVNDQVIRKNLVHANDKDTFKSEVLDASKNVLVVVDFYADWCPPCKMLSPIIESLSKKEFGGQVKFVKVDVDLNGLVAYEYKIMSIPTLLFFKEGLVIETVVGFRNEE